MFDRLVPPALADAAEQHLRGDGVGAGHIVAWLGANSWDALATLAACARIGAVWMPLNGRLAPAELAAQLAHAGAGHLLGTPDGQALAEQTLHALGTPLPARPAAEVEPGDVLLVTTSGTTAAPRAAMHTRAGMEANAAAAIAVQGFNAATRTLAVLPLFHVGGLCIQTVPTLAAGGRVLLQPRFEADAWFDAVAQWRPTTTLLVPAAMRALVQHPRWPQADLSSLAFVNSGSQVVPLPLIEAFHARGVPVAQVYGSTETGPVTIALRPDEALAHPGMAGRPAPGVRVRLGDDGEVFVKAPQLMRGYHRAADRGLDADGWFASGDLARRHDDGFYEIVGRSRERIISGGENIHPGEIEQWALQRPEVADCAVVGVADERWGEVPVLAVVLHPGRALDRAALQAVFDARLARFKHPRRIEVVDALPRTALGKIQRAALGRRLAGQGGG